MITSLQVSEKLKNSLLKLKAERETYEDVIVKLLKEYEEKNKNNVVLLVEGCKEMSSENINITKDFEAVENLEDWKW